MTASVTTCHCTKYWRSLRENVGKILMLDFLDDRQVSGHLAGVRIVGRRSEELDGVRHEHLILEILVANRRVLVDELARLRIPAERPMERPTLDDVFSAGSDEESDICPRCTKPIVIDELVVRVASGFGPRGLAVLKHLKCAVGDDEVSLVGTADPRGA